MKLKIIGKTDKGLKRQVNQDNFKIDESRGVAIVADGMGGHVAGEIAAEIAVNSVIDKLSEIFDSQNGIIYRKDLRNALRATHESIIDSIEKNPLQQGMGTTAVVISCRKSFVSVAHIGDSRLYRWRNNKLKQITVDHSLAQEYETNGVDSSNIAKNIITRALGQKGGLKPETRREKIRENDKFILCSDGLSSMLTDSQIADVLSKKQKIEENIDNLILAALAAGGKDNITVIIAHAVKIDKDDRIDDTPEENYPPDNSYEPISGKQNPKNKKSIFLIAIIILLIAIAIIFIVFAKHLVPDRKPHNSIFQLENRRNCFWSALIKSHQNLYET